VKRCASLQDWYSEVGSPGWRGYLLERPMDDGEYQCLADELQKHEEFQGDGAPCEVVAMDCSTQELEWNIQEAAERLVARLPLPSALGQQVIQDAYAIASRLTGLPIGAACDKVEIKLDLIGANRCPKWHMDNYIGRAIVTYNGAGTEFVSDASVRLRDVADCGKDCCESNFGAARVGDVLFMKGSAFPGQDEALIHRSPDCRYHADGSIRHRICLKVDLPLSENRKRQRSAF
jgi:hypothetical protein